MFYIFLLFHMLLFLEAYLLFQKKLRKRSMILLIANGIVLFTNMIRWLPIFKVPFSSIVFLQEDLGSHPIFNLFWILCNVNLIFLVIYILKYAVNKKRQNSYVKDIILFFLVFFLFFFVILFFSRSASFILFFGFLVLFYLLIKYYLKSRKNYILITILLLFLGIWYSYFTYTGAARLDILLKGYVTEAYETGLEEIKFFEEKNMKKFSPIQKIDLNDGVIGIIEVKKYGFLKFAKSTKDFKN